MADAQALAIDHAFKTQTGVAVDLFGSPGRTAKGAGNGVLGAIFQGGGQAQAVVSRICAQGLDFAQGQAAFGEGAGLVEDHRIDLVQAIEYMAAGQQQAEFVQAAGGGGEGGRRGQRQGAGAGGHQQGEDDPEGAVGVQLPPDQAHSGGSN